MDCSHKVHPNVVGLWLQLEWCSYMDKESVIRFRVSTEDKLGIETQAKSEGVSVSAWIRCRLKLGAALWSGPTPVTPPSPKLPVVTRAGRQVKVEKPASTSDRLRQMRESPERRLVPFDE